MIDGLFEFVVSALAALSGVPLAFFFPCNPCCGCGVADGQPRTDPANEGTWVPSGTWRGAGGVTWTFTANPGDDSGETWFFFGSSGSSKVGGGATLAEREDWGNICNWYSSKTNAPSNSMDVFDKRATRLPPVDAVVHIHTHVSTETAGPQTVRYAYFWNFADLRMGSEITCTAAAHDSVGGAVFNDITENFGTVNGGATFNDNSKNSEIIVSGLSVLGTVNGGATFNDSSDNISIVNDGAVFNDSSDNWATATVNGGATFNDNSRNLNIVNGGAVFNDSAENIDSNIATFFVLSIVNGGAVFNDLSRNFGTVNDGGEWNDTSRNFHIVNGGAVFNDSSGNGEVVNGGAVFNDDSQNSFFGTVNGGATFNNNSTNAGTVNDGATFNDAACSTRKGGNFFNVPCNRIFVAHPTDLPTCNGTAPNGCASSADTCGCG